MNETLQAIYYGKLTPYEGGIPDSEEYKNLKKELADLEAALYRRLQSLSADAAEKCRMFMNDHNYLIAMEKEQSFIDGFCLGVRIMTEAITL